MLVSKVNGMHAVVFNA